MALLINPRTCVLHFLALQTLRLITQEEIGVEDIPNDIFTEFIEVTDEEIHPDGSIDKLDAYSTVEDNQSTSTEDYSEEIIQHVEKIVNKEMHEKTHTLIDVQHAIRMTGMWSSYHLETPRSSQLVDILKILFGKNQTRTRHLLEKFQEKRNDEQSPQDRIDGAVDPSPNQANRLADSRLQLVFPTDESFLAQFHVEERDDMGIDISALEVIQKTFVRFPAFYFNPRIHCYSPFHNETILCSLRPAVF